MHEYFLLFRQTVTKGGGRRFFTLQQSSTWRESARNCCVTQEWFTTHAQKTGKACSHARWQGRKDSMHCRDGWYAMWKTWVSGNSDVHRSSRVSSNVSFEWIVLPMHFLPARSKLSQTQPPVEPSDMHYSVVRRTTHTSQFECVGLTCPESFSASFSVMMHIRIVGYNLKIK